MPLGIVTWITEPERHHAYRPQRIHRSPKEALMKKLYVIAALLMAATAAHAGDAGTSISFQIEGHRIRIEAPRNCESLSCLQISAPSLAAGIKGFKSKRFD